MRFIDRSDAGRHLAEVVRTDLAALDGDVVVLGLPRGGVPVAAAVARTLDAPLDVLVVRKLGVPGHEELAFGALASGGVRFLDDDLIGHLAITAGTVDAVTRREQAELARREHAYRGDRAPLDLSKRTVVVVDDGLATGATMTAAVDAVRAAGAATVVVAVPVGAPSSCAALARRADRVVCLHKPEDLGAVGMWYDDFTPTSDAEVLAALGSSTTSPPT